MNKLLVLFAAFTIAISTTNAHADTLNATLDVGAGAGAVVFVPVGGVESFTYTNTFTDLSLGSKTFLDVFNVDLNATFADVAGIDVLSITDVCINVSLLNAPAGCPNLAFTFADLGVGPANLLSAFGGVNAFVNAGVANFDIGGASIGGGGAVFNFPGTPSPVPEPGTLSMMATGLLGAAGAVRRKMRG
jgi:PEP-CTERM motif